MNAASKWRQNAAVYQIDPRSFQGGSGDGTGNLCKIIQRLGYLEGLGVDALSWGVFTHPAIGAAVNCAALYGPVLEHLLSIPELFSLDGTIVQKRKCSIFTIRGIPSPSECGGYFQPGARGGRPLFEIRQTKLCEREEAASGNAIFSQEQMKWRNTGKNRLYFICSCKVLPYRMKLVA